MTTTTILLSPDDPASIGRAADLLDAGALVALPTETVYGLAADAARGEAVAAVFEAKGRPRFNPLIVHVSDLAMARRDVHLDAATERLAARFWPGPLTLVLPKAAGSAVHPLASGGLDTLALRMPRGAMADVIARLGRPVVAPSANPSGRISPTAASDVMRGLSGRIAAVLDGGRAPHGLESTVVKPLPDRLVLLRPGPIDREALADAAGLPVVDPEAGSGIESPGQLLSHYAPQGRVRLDARRVEPGEALIGFGPEGAANRAEALDFVNLSPSGDLVEAAANLFAALHRFDRPDIEAIAVEPIPATGLGEAIADRLRRAAAPRG
ncbi:L-threonylcarbamoyladenylate synthase [Antarcticirhabdus aurantiaca]|uniref:L-threonylcarbamoyladenylate synthase n=1 Tax=Antarcticirhabdus aurantiaca TaxID=2606717 RepID=A0ACD4NT01_9HYPH|nr:L-threonylcarbamoyladenylate synthase [Antarcticirhabdus aurantiaca]WAJ29801.1 L-threonylcarbamoyladenylate synthase [Jeongeuplla avenae]